MRGRKKKINAWEEVYKNEIDHKCSGFDIGLRGNE